MTTKRFGRGDRVSPKNGGAVMSVVASSEQLAICEWMDGTEQRRSIFSHDDLVRERVTQQAQQPQPPSDAGASTKEDKQ